MPHYQSNFNNNQRPGVKWNNYNNNNNYDGDSMGGGSHGGPMKQRY